MKTRQQIIDVGKIWQVYPNGNPDKVLFEGTKTRCMEYIIVNHGKGEYKRDRIRLAKLILEL